MNPGSRTGEGEGPGRRGLRECASVRLAVRSAAASRRRLLGVSSDRAQVAASRARRRPCGRGRRWRRTCASACRRLCGLSEATLALRQRQARPGSACPPTRRSAAGRSPTGPRRHCCSFKWRLDVAAQLWFAKAAPRCAASRTAAGRRGQGVQERSVLSRPACAHVVCVRATVTRRLCASATNRASLALKFILPTNPQTTHEPSQQRLMRAPLKYNTAATAAAAGGGFAATGSSGSTALAGSSAACAAARRAATFCCRGFCCSCGGSCSCSAGASAASRYGGVSQATAACASAIGGEERGAAS